MSDKTYVNLTKNTIVVPLPDGKTVTIPPSRVELWESRLSAEAKTSEVTEWCGSGYEFSDSCFAGVLSISSGEEITTLLKKANAVFIDHPNIIKPPIAFYIMGQSIPLYLIQQTSSVGNGSLLVEKMVYVAMG